MSPALWILELEALAVSNPGDGLETLGHNINTPFLSVSGANRYPLGYVKLVAVIYIMVALEARSALKHPGC